MKKNLLLLEIDSLSFSHIYNVLYKRHEGLRKNTGKIFSNEK
ncbi:hypothetical protein SAMN05444401_3927 [Clostridium amylolyticum]|uniref:Uncharacterized protein n=1 Tax=Clostridium amylolyticum TaxID=1121298 RepID=A0A1M6MB49_9CLOT|nr:hypothetical protein SAMN05444401_3927 [Clostridium amylolyticum]